MNESREQKVQSILHRYLQAVDRGEKPDRQAILNAHPELREELVEFFADASKLEAMAKSLKTASLGGGSGEASTSVGKIRYFGDYELLEEIARGGMGVVYRAKQVSLNRIVALKMILKGELASEADVRRFRQEAEAAANLDHPNIVPIYEVGEHQGQQYFSMKLIETAAGGLALREVAARLAKVARAVHHAHQRGILHRDLKPSNILIDKDGEPHVADFGLAKKVEGGEDATKSGAIVGTPAYMAPEQAQAEKSLTTAVDVWSLGAILYEWLTGRPPFRGDDAISTLLKVVNEEPAKLRSLNPIIDRDLETICLKCLEKEPAKRYRSAEALAEDIDHWRCGEPILARSAGRAERAYRWCRRNPVLASMSGALVISVLMGLLLVTRFWMQAEHSRREAERRRDQSITQLARTYVSRATEQVEREDLVGALPWLVSAWPLEQGDAARDRMHRLRLDLLEKQIPRLLWERQASESPGPPGGRTWMDFTPDGSRVVSVGGGGVNGWIEVRETATSQLVGERITVPFRPSSAVLDSVGRLIAVGQESFASRMLIYDLTTGKRVSREGKEGELPGCTGCFSPEGKQLLLSTVMELRMNAYAGKVQLWDWAAAKPVWPAIEIGLCGNGDRLDQVSPDGKVVLIAGSGEAQLLDRATGKPLHKAWLCDSAWAAFRPDSKVVATVQRGHLLLTEIASGKTHAASTLPSDAVRWGWFTHGGRYVLTLGPFGEVGVYDSNDGSRVRETSPPQRRIDGPVAASPDGQMVAFADASMLYFQKVEDTTPLLKLPLPNVRQICFHPDSRRVLTLDGAGRLRLWDLATTGQTPLRSESFRTMVQSSTGPTALATATRVTLYNQDLAKPLTEPLSYSFSEVDSSIPLVSFSPDGGVFFVAHHKTLRAWDAATGVPRGKPLTLSGNIRHFASGADGRFAAVASEAGALVWEPTSQKPPVVLTKDGQGAFVSIDGDRVLIGADLQWYDRTTGAASGEPQKIPLNSESKREMRSLRDGRHLLVVDGKRVRLWDLFRNEPAGPAFTPPEGLCDLVLTRDRTRYATFTANGLARIWDRTTNEPLTPPLRHHPTELIPSEAPPGMLLLAYFSLRGNRSITFSPDETMLVTCGYDTRLWDVKTGDLVAARLDGYGPIFTPSGKLRTIGRGVVLETELKPTPQSPEHWQERSAMLSGIEIDSTGGYVPLTRSRQPVVPVQSISDADARFHRERFIHLSALTELSLPEYESGWQDKYQLEAALWHLDRVKHQDANDHDLRGKIYRTLGQWDLAHAAWSQALKAGRDDADLRAGQGYVLARLGRWPEAAIEFAQARKLSPERFPPRRITHGESPIFSLAHREAVARLFMDDVDAYRQLCREELAQARQLSADLERRFYTAWLCSLGSRPIEETDDILSWAKQRLKQAKHLDHADAHLVIAGLLLQRSRAKEALLHLEKNSESGDLMEHYARTHFRRAQAYLALGQKAEAQKSFDAAKDATGWGGDSWWLTAERDLLRRRVETILKK